jgi:hypothetical protein
MSKDLINLIAINTNSSFANSKTSNESFCFLQSSVSSLVATNETEVGKVLNDCVGLLLIPFSDVNL